MKKLDCMMARRGQKPVKRNWGGWWRAGAVACLAAVVLPGCATKRVTMAYRCDQPGAARAVPMRTGETLVARPTMPTPAPARLMTMRAPEALLADTGSLAVRTSEVKPIPGKKLRVVFVKVGQGDCTLLLCPDGRNILVDCGSTNLFDSIRVGALMKKELGEGGKIDLLVVTHPDSDHYNQIGPILGMPGKPVYRVERLVHVAELSEYKGDFRNWVRDFPATRTKVLGPKDNAYPAKVLAQYGGVQLRVLAANTLEPEHNSPLEKPSPSNSRSIVLKVSYGGFDMVLPGDATAVTDAAILSRYAGGKAKALKVELVKAGHHGSWATATKDSSWADAVKPEVFLASASGVDYGHPSANLSDFFMKYLSPTEWHNLVMYRREKGPNGKLRTRELGENEDNAYERKSIYLTATNGDVVVETDGAGYEVSFND
jgi:competence protein ComEC